MGYGSYYKVTESWLVTFWRKELWHLHPSRRRECLSNGKDIKVLGKTYGSPLQHVSRATTSCPTPPWRDVTGPPKVPTGRLEGPKRRRGVATLSSNLKRPLSSTISYKRESLPGRGQGSYNILSIILKGWSIISIHVHNITVFGLYELRWTGFKSPRVCVSCKIRSFPLLSTLFLLFVLCSNLLSRDKGSFISFCTFFLYETSWRGRN